MGSARTGSNPVVIAFRSDVVGFFFDKRKDTARRDTVAERLRRRPAKPLGSARVGSNPIGVVLNDWKLLIIITILQNRLVAELFGMAMPTADIQ